MPALLFGEEALAQSAVLSLTYPIEHGIIRDVEAMTALWQYVFQKVDPNMENECTRVILTESALNPTKNREIMQSIFLNTFKFAGIFISVQAVLALYSQGTTYFP